MQAQSQASGSAQNQAMSQREFAFTQADFDAIIAIVKEKTGIVLSPQKQEMVYSRLSRRIRAVGLNSFQEYRDLIASEAGKSEFLEAMNNITTNLTRYFRELHHFESLVKDVLVPFREDQMRGPSRTLRIWSAGCSTGEEPYSIAMSIAETIPGYQSLDIKILATDIDTNVLAKARAGIYPKAGLEDSPKRMRPEFFEPAPGDQVKVIDPLRRMIAFKPLNLIGPWPLKQQYDVIFCRNVLIYFDADTKATLVDRYADQLVPGGTLFLGHSESLHNPCNKISLAGTTTYRRRT